MTRRDWLRYASAAPLLAAGLRADETIPAHPQDLKFKPLVYDPPEPAGYRHELPNGAVAYLVEDHTLPLVDVSALIKGGAYLTPRSSWGLAQMTGSQMRVGGTISISPRDLDEELAFLASDIGTSFGDTSGSASMSCLKANLDRTLELFFDVLKNPRFDEQRFQLAVAQSLQSMERRNDDTGSISGREYQRLLRGDDHFSTWQTTKPSLESITIDKMREFHQTYLYPGSFIFSVSGDFDTKEMVDKLSEAMSAPWPAKTKPALPPIPAPTHVPAPGVYMVQKGGVNQSQIQMGHIGIERSNPDHFAVSVMNYILGGGGFISRITQRVRSDEGLAYSAGSSFSPGTYYPGTFTAGFQSVNARCAQATTIVVEEVRRIREEKVSQEELDISKNYVIEIFPRFFATAGQVAGTFAADEFTGREKGFWQTYRDHVAAVTPDDVLRVAQTYLHPDKLVILGVGEVGQMLAGNPDQPEYSFQKFAGDAGVQRIPLPDPLTLEYPKA
ncbi:MAG: pitrilysin family protein [Bryobacterales bacterium]